MAKVELTHWLTANDVKTLSKMLKKCGADKTNKTIYITHNVLGDGKVMKTLSFNHDGVNYSHTYNFDMKDVEITNDRLGLKQ